MLVKLVPLITVLLNPVLVKLLLVEPLLVKRLLVKPLSVEPLSSVNAEPFTSPLPGFVPVADRRVFAF
jgi:hypothetical protein